MNKSRWADEGNLHFPLKLGKGADGKRQVTCVLAKGKVWAGDTDEQAIRAARNDLKGMQEKSELATNTPKWAASGDWKLAEKK